MNSADIYTVQKYKLLKRGHSCSSKSAVCSVGGSVELIKMCTAYTFVSGQYYQNEASTSCNPEVYYHIIQTSGVEQNETDCCLFIQLQFTDSTAGSGPDLGDVDQASGPGEEDPASVEEGVLSGQATSQG